MFSYDISVLRTYFILILVMFLWSVCYPLISLSLPYSPLILTAFFRSVMAGVVLLLIAITLGHRAPKKVSEWVIIVMIGLTATSIGFWGMFYAGSLISPGLATVLTSMQPLIASILGWYFLDEKINRNIIAGLTMGFLGIIFLSINSITIGNINILVGMLYVLGAAIGIAISNVLLKKLSSTACPFYVMGLQLLIGSIPLGLMSLTAGEFSQFQFSYVYMLVLVVLAIFGTALPFVLWFWLLQKNPLYRMNVFSFMTPIFGLLIGYLYFSESLVLLQWLGVFIVSLGVYLVNASPREVDV